ncbi:hypothetical protein GGQ57_003849 [Parabacteroides faecis]|uniref:Uncharacterized protein n=1 Tax=Parabacteroides faecis TaxID=1217282 RepID=A0ABR6KQY6_9BACT|nr:hypothetical protein [Parabacteroides faecis]
MLLTLSSSGTMVNSTNTGRDYSLYFNALIILHIINT